MYVMFGPGIALLPTCRLHTEFWQIEEVKGVVQVLDPEEETAMQEFAKFEEKLKHQREKSASPTTEH